MLSDFRYVLDMGTSLDGVVNKMVDLGIPSIKGNTYTEVLNQPHFSTSKILTWLPSKIATKKLFKNYELVTAAERKMVRCFRS